MGYFRSFCSVRLAVIVVCLVCFMQANAQFTTTLFDTAAVKGYFLFSTDERLNIIDKYGDFVYYKPLPPAGINGNFSIQPNGLMAYANKEKFYLMDSTFRVKDSVSCKGVFANDFHEMQILPNGHYLLLGVDSVTVDLSQYNWKGSPGKKNTLMLSAVIQEQDANKNVVFEWHARDHFKFTDADTFYFSENADTLQLTRANGLELDKDGNILLSSYNLNEITKINRKTGDIMWRMGGYQNRFKFRNYQGPFYAIHDVRRLSNGHLTLFDNGFNEVSHGARALEFEVDEKKEIATLTWSYTFDSTMFSLGRGNVQRLKNGNTLVNYGNLFHKLVSFVEVNPSGNILFRLDGATIYRAYNYLTLPWKLHRPAISCFDSLGITYLDAGPGYNTYLWNNAEANSMRIIPITNTGTYYVDVPCGDGGFIRSQPLVITTMPYKCGVNKTKTASTKK